MLLNHSEAHPSQPRLVDINGQDHPLYLTVDAGLKEIAQALIIHNVDIYNRDRYDQPLLHQAASNGHDDVNYQTIAESWR